jgi:L-cysteine:1D-myo-inositol 2-amino-2-deoxy-alpha-D-glucopyranoside ligase
METWRAVGVPSLPGPGAEPHLADTATGELTRAAAGQRASLYACGITPYDATHLGHAATYVAWDLLVRAWLDSGHEVTYAQNVTDVDDPLLERAGRDGEDWRELADREITRYRGDMEALRVLPPARLVGAVEALPLIERMNQALADRGALYEVERDVYFSRAADPAFGSVSHLDQAAMLELSAERGGDPARPGKKDPLDPMVWLTARPGEPSWESGFGPGRPGWHVECAAIATACLGEDFDVQAGGSDLIFPHHEFSASHARVAFADGAPGRAIFARCYAHAGMVRYDGEKMSKSLGNLVFVSRLVADGVDPMAIRLAILAHHYRGDWDWTAEGLAAAQDRLARWRAAVDRAGVHRAGSGAGSGSGSAGGAPGSGVPGAGSGSGSARGAPGSGVPGAGSGSGSAGGAPGSGVPAGGVPAGGVPAAESVLAAVRERLADDLDAPGALAAADHWASAVTGVPELPPGMAVAAELVRDTVDALLGIAL